MSLRTPSTGRSAAQNDQVDSRPRPAPPVPDWSRLYEQHRPAMFRVAVAGLKAAGRSTVDALDIVNDAFYSIMKKPPDGEVDSWEGLLVKATLRKLMDRLKSADSRYSQLMPPARTESRSPWNRRQRRTSPNSSSDGRTQPVFAPGCSPSSTA